MRKKWWIVLVSVMAAFFVGVGCSEKKKSVEPQKQQETVAFEILSKPNGNTALLSANTVQVALPEEYKSLPQFWSSSDESVATVDGEGKITLLKGGETVITVLLKDDITKRASFVLTVVDDVNLVYAQSVQIQSPCEQVALQEESFSLNATFDQDGCIDGFTWSVSDETVLQIVSQENGICTFKPLKAGTCTVSVKSSRNGEIQDSCEIEVIANYRAESVSLLGVVTDTIITGKTVALTAQITPSEASANRVTWSSSDEEILTVDENGNVTAVSVGSAEIVCTVENVGEEDLEKRFSFTVCEANAYYETFEDTYYCDGNTLKGSFEIGATARNQVESIFMTVTDKAEYQLADTGYSVKVDKTGTSVGSWSFVDIKLPSVKQGEKYKLSFFLDFLRQPSETEASFYVGVLNPLEKLIFPNPEKPGDYCGFGSWQLSRSGKQYTLSLDVNDDYNYLTLRILGVSSMTATDSAYSYILDDVKFNQTLTVENTGTFGGEFVSVGADEFCTFTTKIQDTTEYNAPLGTVSCRKGKTESWRGMTARIYADEFLRGRYTLRIKVKNVSLEPLNFYMDIAGVTKNTNKELGRLVIDELKEYTYTFELNEDVAENTFLQLHVFCMTEEGHTFEFGDISLDFEENYEFANTGSFGGTFTSINGSNGAIVSKKFADASKFSCAVARVTCGEGSATAWRGVTMRMANVTKAGRYTLKFKVLNKNAESTKFYFDVAGANKNANKELGNLASDELKEYTYTFELSEAITENTFVQLHVFCMTATGHTFEIGDISLEFEEV